MLRILMIWTLYLYEFFFYMILNRAGQESDLQLDLEPSLAKLATCFFPSPTHLLFFFFSLFFTVLNVY